MAPRLDLLSRLESTSGTVWKALSKHIDKPTATLVFITLTMLVVFETILFSSVVALYFLNSLR